jgi:hypothetical protein
MNLTAAIAQNLHVTEAYRQGKKFACWSIFFTVSPVTGRSYRLCKGVCIVLSKQEKDRHHQDMGFKHPISSNNVHFTFFPEQRGRVIIISISLNHN